MANEFFTLIVVPHAKARFRKIQVPVRFAKWVVGGLLTLGLGFTGIFIHYLWISSEVYELNHLRAQNAQLTQRTREYEESVGKLQTKVQTLQRMVDKLGVMAGLETSLPEPGVGGVGGVPSTESRAPSLDASLSLHSMDQNLSTLVQKSNRLEEFYRDRRILLAATPSIWPVRGYLSSGFGNRIDPFTQQKDFHSGIDIATPIGTKVQAPADGVVVLCAEKGGYGRSIIIDHGYGIVTRYGHLDGYKVRAGQKVHRGDAIGFVGNTGRSAAPHLHYEVWVRDQAQNPIHFILDEYRSFG